MLRKRWNLFDQLVSPLIFCFLAAALPNAKFLPICKPAPLDAVSHLVAALHAPTTLVLDRLPTQASAPLNCFSWNIDKCEDGPNEAYNNLLCQSTWNYTTNQMITSGSAGIGLQTPLSEIRSSGHSIGFPICTSHTRYRPWVPVIPNPCPLVQQTDASGNPVVDASGNPVMVPDCTPVPTCPPESPCDPLLKQILFPPAQPVVVVVVVVAVVADVLRPLF